MPGRWDSSINHLTSLAINRMESALITDIPIYFLNFQSKHAGEQCCWFFGMNKSLVLMGFLMVSASWLAQTSDTLIAHQNLEKGHHFHRELREFDSAYVYYRKAAAAFEEVEQVERHAYAVLRSAFSAHRSQNYQQAEIDYKAALSLYEGLYPTDDLELAGPNMGLGTLYSVTGNYYQALKYTNRSLELKRKFLGEDHIDTGVNYYNSGTAYMNYGEYDAAMNAFQNALRIYLIHYPEQHRRLSSLYVNMGILYDKRGEPGKALEYYHKSTEIDKVLYGEEFYLLAYNYYNMAISYVNLEQRELAADYYQRSVDLSERSNLHELHASSYYGLGRLAAARNKHQQALGLYQQAVDHFTKHLGEDFPGINHSYRALAETYQAQGAYQRAQEYLKKTLDLLGRNFEPRHPFTASTYRQLADLYNDQGKYNDALTAIDLGFAALLKSDRPEQSSSSSDYLDQYTLLDLIRQKGEILTSKYQSTKSIVELELALTTLRRAAEFIDQIRQGFVLDQSKLLLQEEAMETYEQAIEIAYQLYILTAEEQYPAIIFELMEKSKATLLAESLHGNSLDHINGIPDSLLQQEKELKRMISFTESQTSEDPDSRDSLKTQLFELGRSYDALSESIAEEYPRYYNLKYSVSVTPLEQARKIVDHRQAVLSYFVGEKAWYILGFDREQHSVHKIDSSTLKLFDSRDFMESIKSYSQPFDQNSAYQLYQQLVEKPLLGLDARSNRLIIVPSGILGHLPYDALCTLPNPDENGKIRFLIRDYAVSYTPSFTMLSLSANSTSQTGIGYEGFAPVDYNEQLETLKGSLNEVTLAHQLFGGTTYLKQQASETNFKNIESASIIHLAMHAQVDDSEPMRSRLIFANQLDTLEDGNLYANEIYNLNLNSNLAILSACNTGYGRIARGEGIMNLSRAFQYAGTSTIVMSLWKATDASTTEIMQGFFKKLKQGVSKDEALRQAKLGYLSRADPLKAHPAHWATFVVLGDPAPMKFSKGRWRWATIGGLFLLSFIWFIRKSRSRITK